MTIHDANSFKFECGDESYENIRAFGLEMKPIIELYYEEAAKKLDGEILSAVNNVGINVDKERLLQALTDARAFYDEGYEAGKRDAMKDKMKAINALVALACCSITELNCYECPFYNKRHDADGICRPWTDEEIVEAVRVFKPKEDA